MGTPEQEAAARAAGFPSYEAQIAWARQRMTHSGGTVQGKGAAPAPAPTKKAEPQSRNVFNYIGDVLNRAMGGK